MLHAQIPIPCSGRFATITVCLNLDRYMTQCGCQTQFHIQELRPRSGAKTPWTGVDNELRNFRVFLPCSKHDGRSKMVGNPEGSLSHVPKALCVSNRIVDYPTVVHYRNGKHVASWHSGHSGPGPHLQRSRYIFIQITSEILCDARPSLSYVGCGLYVVQVLSNL